MQVDIEENEDKDVLSAYDTNQAMAFDGCFHDADIELTPFPPMPSVDQPMSSRDSSGPDPTLTLGTRLRCQRSLRRHLQRLTRDSNVIDSSSRMLFPLAYLLFNII